MVAFVDKYLVLEKVVEMNEGRKGKKVVRTNGEEIENSLVLDSDTFAVAKHNEIYDMKTVKVVSFDQTFGERHEVTLTRDEILALAELVK